MILIISVLERSLAKHTEEHVTQNDEKDECVRQHARLFSERIKKEKETQELHLKEKCVLEEKIKVLGAEKNVLTSKHKELDKKSADFEVVKWVYKREKEGRKQ